MKTKIKKLKHFRSSLNLKNAKLIFILHCTLYILHSTFIFAQQNDMQFVHYNADNGLSSSAITCIIQDSQGFIWFGTNDGLNRFDGYNFKIFKNIPGDSTSISSNGISCFCLDNKRRLWIGTVAGLNLFNSETNTFTVYTENKKDANSLKNKYVQAITCDKSGTLWIGCWDGLVKFIPDKNQFTWYPFPEPERKTVWNWNVVNGITFDNTGTLWCSSGGSGLHSFNTQNCTLQTNLYFHKFNSI